MAYTVTQLRRDLHKRNQRRPALYIGDGNWGGHAWDFLYNGILAFEGTEIELKAFFQSLGPMLPCADCRAHYSSYVVKKGLPCSAFAAFMWLTELETTIARRLGKKSGNRLRQIRKKSTNPRMQIINERAASVEERPAKKEDIISRLDPRACPNCGKSRAELGVTAAGMGLQGVGSRGGGGIASGLKAARSIGALGYGR